MRGIRGYRHSRLMRGLTAGLGAVLAAAAMAALFVTDSPRMLRFAVLIALWAVVVVAGLAIRNRPTSPTDGAVKDMYGPERELASWREYEARLEAKLRRELETELRADLDALREDLRMIRQTIDRWDNAAETAQTLCTSSTGLSEAGLHALEDRARQLASQHVPTLPAAAASSAALASQVESKETPESGKHRANLTGRDQLTELLSSHHGDAHVPMRRRRRYRNDA